MNHARRGAMLLDVLVALAIFVLAAVAILALMDRSAEGLSRAREAHAADAVARSALALVGAGLETPERLRGDLRPRDESATSDDRRVLRVPAICEGWRLELDTEPSRFEGLTIVTARVRGPGVGDNTQGRVLAELRELQSASLGRGGTRGRGNGASPRRAGRPAHRAKKNARSTYFSARRSAGWKPAPPDRMPASPGFTLAETLLALALVVALSGAILAFVWRLADTRRAILTQLSTQDAASLVLDRLESDLQGVVTGHAKHGSGLTGGPRNLQLLTRGVWLAATSEESERWASDLQVTQIAFTPATGQVTLRRAVEPGVLEGESMRPIAGGVRWLQLRYAHRGTWALEFNAAQTKSLPDAVEVSIWFGPRIEDDEDAKDPTPPTPPDVVRVLVIPESMSMLEGEAGP